MKNRTKIDISRLLKEQVLVLDGAMGTAIQDAGLSPSDFGGLQYEGCNEYLNITRPDLIMDIHRAYLEAGVDIIETNSFGSTPLVLAEYGLEDLAFEINQASARIAREAVDELSTREHPRFVAGSIGPTTKSLALTRGISWDELMNHYYIQVSGLVDGGVDLLLVETSQDILNVKAALVAIDRLSEERSIDIPVAVQCTIEIMGTTLGGQDIEAFYNSLSHRDLLWIGMNCATGPEFMRGYLRALSQISKFPVSVVPNAGLPDEDGQYNETPDIFSATVNSYIRERWANVVGGCCGTTIEHVGKLVEGVKGISPREVVSNRTTVVSGLESLIVDENTRPVLIGERTNVLGSRKFKKWVSEAMWEEAAELGRRQVRGGASLLDVCLQDPDRDEMADVDAFLEFLTRKVKVGIVIDSTDPNVIANALKRTPGKSIINSINLEDGEERFAQVIPLVHKFGAAVVVGCIDDDKEQAQAITKTRKLEIARRSYKLLTEKYGLLGENIIFDPLVFPVGTGDKNYIGSGVETIEGIRLIKEEFPLAKTVLGISNVSFGLPPAGREVLNSVFLYHCVQAGLDMAIVNSQMIIRYPSIPEEERKLAENLIWWTGNDPIGDFALHFRERKNKNVLDRRKGATLDDRIAFCVIDGTKDGLFEDLQEALLNRSPLEIINGPLMAGMDEVGKLFASNELIVAEVLSSAESMKAAVSFLEPYMDKDELASRGTMLLATVKGDVHDIGKNLVDIILSNNGYKVINLGIKITSQELIQAYQDYLPDMIGLSGLLVKSTQMMMETARDLKNSEIACPILVGGAALSNRFTRLRIGPEYDGIVVYARDAMTGLDLANQIRQPEKLQNLASRIDEEYKLLKSDQEAKDINKEKLQPKVNIKTSVQLIDDPPVPPDLLIHKLLDYELEEIFDYINPVMLYVRHLGFRGKFEDALKNGDPKAKELKDKVEQVQEVMIKSPDIQAKAVYGFFRSASDGNDTLILSGDGKEIIQRFSFGRQLSGEGLCISDYLTPFSSGKADYIATFVTTVGPGVRDLANRWMESGEYLASHILQVLALEGAEGFAEVLHKKIRSMWGFSDALGIQPSDIFKANYRGRRYSFGYPACPKLEDQEILWELLKPESNIGVSLTEGFMMEPEGSVSALVFHHPQAKYFNLGASDLR